MTEMPLVSVILPVYNMAQKLPRCVESLMRQTYPKLEFLFVDDGSTDESALVLSRYAEKDARIRVIAKGNGGVSSARNEGLRQMRGEYATFVDPDDTVSKEYVRLLLEALQTQRTKLSCCRIRVLSETEAGKAVPEKTAHEPAKMATLKDYDQWGAMAHVQCYGAMYHRSLLTELRFDESIRYAEDTLFYMQALLSAGSVAYLPEKLYYYVEWNGSALRRPYTPVQYSDVTVWAEICRMTRDVSPRLYQSSRTKYAFACTRAFYYSLTSREDCEGIRWDAVRRLRKNWHAVLQMPDAAKHERRKALLAMCCPRAAKHLWHRAKAE